MVYAVDRRQEGCTNISAPGGTKKSEVISRWEIKNSSLSAISPSDSPANMLRRPFAFDINALKVVLLSLLYICTADNTMTASSTL